MAENQSDDIAQSNTDEEITTLLDKPTLASDISISLDSLTQSIDISGENIEKAISQANNKNIYDHSLVITLTSALIAGTVAYITNILFWKFIKRAERTSKIANTLSIAINNLEENSVNYWLNGNSNNNRDPEIIAKEIKIKSEFKLVRDYISIFLKCAKKEISDTDKDKLSTFPTEMFEIITGGEFESSLRRPSIPTARSISSKSSTIQLILSKYAHNI